MIIKKELNLVDDTAWPFWTYYLVYMTVGFRKVREMSL